MRRAFSQLTYSDFLSGTNLPAGVGIRKTGLSSDMYSGPYIKARSDSARTGQKRGSGDAASGISCTRAPF